MESCTSKSLLVPSNCLDNKNSIDFSENKNKDLLENNLIYDVFIFCGGKCGSSTLDETFTKNSYKTLHSHSNSYYKSRHNGNNIFNVINLSSINNNIYIIDCYRNPIERKISSFFQGIHKSLPNYKNLKITELVDYFNTNLLHKLENYHPINELFLHYNISLWEKFDFEKKYNIFIKDNKIFIKILFNDIKIWDKILSEIFKKKIIIYNRNITKEKPIIDIYNKFKTIYKVPKIYINDILKNDTEFKIYNTQLEQDEYIKNWLNKSF